MSILILAGAALLPPLILCIYVFCKDRVEKEPIKLLLGLLAMGALSCLPAAICGSIFENHLLNPAFSAYFPTAADGALSVSGNLGYFYHFLDAFFGVALFEEGFKFLFLLWVTKKSKHFNSLFDGMIYAIFVSLGFAALENILYVLDGGLGTALARALLSVPGHMFNAVLMGYYYSQWHVLDKANTIEAQLAAAGVIPPGSSKYSTAGLKIRCLAIPVLSHGFYDFCLFTGSTALILIFLGYVVFLYIHCFKKIKRMSKADGLTGDYVAALVLKKHPALDLQTAAMVLAQTDSSPAPDSADPIVL